MNTHVIEASRLCGVKKVIAMGTIAAYPEPSHQPVKEEQIWEGPPHGSESSYGHAKRAMLAQLLAYRETYGLDFSYVISTNLFGPNDKFNSQFGHVIPSLIRKFYEAKKNGSDVVIWGDGTAARDFLYSKDMARALILIMNKYSGSINVASGKKTPIREVVQLLSDYFGIQSQIHWDSQKPNGRKFYEIDLSHLQSIGFEPARTLEEGLIETLDWFSLKFEENLVRG
jgi:GDP-L-fucose synthase